MAPPSEVVPFEVDNTLLNNGEADFMIENIDDPVNDDLFTLLGTAVNRQHAVHFAVIQSFIRRYRRFKGEKS